MRSPMSGTCPNAVARILAPVAGPMWFKVVQSCETGSNQWVQIPADGQSPHSLASPAALLDVIGSGAGAHAH